jgi:hypothetical protein
MPDSNNTAPMKSPKAAQINPLTGDRMKTIDENEGSTVIVKDPAGKNRKYKLRREARPGRNAIQHNTNQITDNAKNIRDNDSVFLHTRVPCC